MFERFLGVIKGEKLHLQDLNIYLAAFFFIQNSKLNQPEVFFLKDKNFVLDYSFFLKKRKKIELFPFSPINSTNVIFERN